MMANVNGTTTCVFGGAAGKDRIEHQLLCNKVWRFLGAPLPHGYGLKQEGQNFQAVMLGVRGGGQQEKILIAILASGTSKHTRSGAINIGHHAHSC
jgi:hypothetical protein